MERHSRPQHIISDIVRAAIGIDHGPPRIAAHSTTTQFMIGDGLVVNPEDLRAGGLQDLHRPMLHLREDLLIVVAPGNLASRLRQSELVHGGPIQIHIGFAVWKHLAVR